MSWQICPAGELSRFQDEWQVLNDAGPRSPLLEPAFILPALTAFGSGNEKLCLYGDAPKRAMALVAPKGRMGWEVFQPSQVPMGPWLIHDTQDMGQCLGELLHALPGMPMALGVTQLDPDLYTRPPDTLIQSTLDYIETARVSVSGSFDEYWAARGKNLRHNMKKQRTQLEKAGIATRLEKLTKPGEMAEAVRDYGKLESQGWKSEGGTAIHPDNAQGRFYQSMLENFCAMGRGRIYRYWFNDDVVAMDLCVEGYGTLVILKTTYDEQKANGTSPAFLMRQEIFMEVFGEGQLKTIEFYGKLMEWHKRWTEEVRTMYHINRYRWPLIGWMKDLKKKR